MNLRDIGVEGSNPFTRPFFVRSVLDTSVTFYTDDMGNTLAAKGLSAHSKRGLVVEEPEVVVHEADQPDFFADLLDADLLTCEHRTEVDFARVEADSTAHGHLHDAANGHSSLLGPW